MKWHCHGATSIVVTGQHIVATDNPIHDKSSPPQRCQHLPSVHGRCWQRSCCDRDLPQLRLGIARDRNPMVATICQDRANSFFGHRHCLGLVVAFGHHLRQCRYRNGETTFLLRLHNHGEIETVRHRSTPWSRESSYADDGVWSQAIQATPRRPAQQCHPPTAANTHAHTAGSVRPAAWPVPRPSRPHRSVAAGPPPRHAAMRETEPPRPPTSAPLAASD